VLQALPHCGAEQQVVWSHTSPIGQAGAQVMSWPQPSSTSVAQRPLHGLLFGEQHLPASTSQTPPFGHSPLLPQMTGWLQLSSACPHSIEPHALGRGEQPQVVLRHMTPASQRWQSTIFPQLSEITPQWPLHQAGSGWQTHSFVVGSQVQFGAQLLLHGRSTPQLSGPVPQCVVHQFGSNGHASLPSSGLASPAPSASASRPPSWSASPLESRPSGPSELASAETSEPVVVSSDASTGRPSSMPRIDPQATDASAPPITRAASAPRKSTKRKPTIIPDNLPLSFDWAATKLCFFKAEF
jgi:hypothetical protein